jgi:hypothetical protein
MTCGTLGPVRERAQTTNDKYLRVRYVWLWVEREPPEIEYCGSNLNPSLASRASEILH